MTKQPLKTRNSITGFLIVLNLINADKIPTLDQELLYPPLLMEFKYHCTVFYEVDDKDER